MILIERCVSLLTIQTVILQPVTCGTNLVSIPLIVFQKAIIKWIYNIYRSSYSSSSWITVPGSHRVDVGALQSRPELLPIVLNQCFRFQFKSKANHCEIGSLGQQYTWTFKMGTVGWKSPNQCELGGMSAGFPVGQSVNLYTFKLVIV